MFIVVGLLVLPEAVPQLFSASVVMPQYRAEELWENPLPLPSVMEVYENEGGGICVAGNAHELWELSDRDIVRSVRDTTGVTIDGRIIPRYKLFFAEGGGLYAQFNAQGDIVDSYGGDISICFETSQLTPGLHVATIRFESNAVTPYSHEWAFKVN
jgi:hypothetical protein